MSKVECHNSDFQQTYAGYGDEFDLEKSLRSMILGQPDTQDIAKASESLKTAILPLFMGGTVEHPPYDFFYLNSLLAINTWHFRCIDLKATIAAGIDWELEFPNNTEAPKEYNAIYRLFYRPNKQHKERDINDLAKALVFDLETFGNSFFEVARNTKGDPEELRHMPALITRVDSRGFGFWQIGIVDGVYSKRFFKHVGDVRDWDNRTGTLAKSGTSSVYLASEAVQLRHYSTDGGCYGIPPYISAILGMKINRAGGEYNEGFFKHQTIPNKIIIFKGMKPDAATAKKLEDYWQFGLRGRTFTPLVLSVDDPQEGQTIDVIDLKRGSSGTTEEGSFIPLGNYTRDETLAAHGVPASMLGVSQPGRLGGQGDSETARRDFKNFRIKPLQCLVEKSLDVGVIELGFGLNAGELWLELGDFDLSDHDFALAKAREMRSQVGIGIRTINEARKAVGLDPVLLAVADELMMQTSSGPMLLRWIEPDKPFPAFRGANNAPMPLMSDDDVEGMKKAIDELTNRMNAGLQGEREC